MYTTQISVDFANYELFRVEVDKLRRYKNVHVDHSFGVGVACVCAKEGGDHELMFLFLHQTNVVSTQKNCRIEAALSSTYIVCSHMFKLVDNEIITVCLMV